MVAVRGLVAWWDWHVEECDAVRGRHFVALNAAEAPSARPILMGGVVMDAASGCEGRKVASGRLRL